VTVDSSRVVLLDDSGAPVGTAEKVTVHGPETPLHLGFSCHVLLDDGSVLLTRRALSKLTFPGVWTNAFCGHPAPGEDVADAVHRHARDELGIRLAELRLVLPDFRYRAVDSNGVVEYEVCPVYVARAVGEPVLNPAEVADRRAGEAHAAVSLSARTPSRLAAASAAPCGAPSGAQWPAPSGAQGACTSAARCAPLRRAIQDERCLDRISRPSGLSS
jgi:isopentenyl-diphosphate delta-isomerase